MRDTATASKAIKAIARASHPDDPVSVPAIDDMDDETFIKHMELRHPDWLELKFPGPAPRSMGLNRLAFEALHTVKHRIAEQDGYTFDHTHREREPKHAVTSY
jgi:hypothetical protein